MPGLKFLSDCLPGRDPIRPIKNQVSRATRTVANARLATSDCARKQLTSPCPSPSVSDIPTLTRSAPLTIADGACVLAPSPEAALTAHSRRPKLMFLLSRNRPSSFIVAASASACASSASCSVASKSRRRASRAATVSALPAQELAQVAEGGVGGVLAIFGVAGGLAAVSALSAARIEQRVDEAIAKAESYGIDLTDLYYDFDVPGDQYPFGDGEDWMPASWKPPKTGDSKYLPTKMLGQIQIRTNQYEAIEKCKAAGIDIEDLCVPFEGYEGEFDTNAKRLIEMRKRLEAAGK